MDRCVEGVCGVVSGVVCDVVKGVACRGVWGVWKEGCVKGVKRCM